MNAISQIANNTSCIDFYSYSFAPGKEHLVSYKEHFERQICNTWTIPSFSILLSPLPFITKAIADVASKLFHQQSNQAHAQPPFNRPLNNPLRFAWHNPFKMIFATTLTALVNSGLHLTHCLGEHIYTMRSWSHTHLNESESHKIDLTILSGFILEKLIQTNNLTLSGDSNFNHKVHFLSSWIRAPSYIFTHLNRSFVNTTLHQVQKDKRFKTLTQDPNAIDKIDLLIYQKLLQIYNKTYS